MSRLSRRDWLVRLIGFAIGSVLFGSWLIAKGCARHALDRQEPPTGQSAPIRIQPAVRLSALKDESPWPADAAVTPERLGAIRFASEMQRWRAEDPVTKQPVVRVPIALVGPSVPLSVNLPISGGVPFAMGQLKPGAAIQLYDDGGTVWPIQTRPLATWQDGSVKWLLVSTRVPMNARGRALHLEYGEAVAGQPVPAPHISVEQTPERVTVTTGPLRFSVSTQHFSLFESAYVDSNQDGLFSEQERLASAGDLIVKRQNTEFRSSLDTQSYQLTVEESGPLRATLKATGWFRDTAGKGFCRFTVRIQAFAGLPQVRLYHTLIYTGDPDHEPIRAISLELPVTMISSASVVTADERSTFTVPLEEPLSIAQQAHNVYQVRQGASAIRQGSQHEGWLLVQDASGGVLVSVRDAWQQYPKELTVDRMAQRITVKLWPESAGELNLSTPAPANGSENAARGSAFGLAKTHELTIGFLGAHVEPDIARAVASLWSEPWLLAADPTWIQATDVLGPIGAPQPEHFADVETMLADLFDWADRQPKQFAWYGMLDYGDTLQWYRKEEYPDWGWHPDARWGWHNVDGVGTHAAALRHFLRTRDLRAFQFGEAKARHVMDVDTVHDDTVGRDPRLASVLPSLLSHVGSMHRHGVAHWSGRNETASHTNVEGLLLYYHLTGYDRAWEVVNEVGGFLLADPVADPAHPDAASLRAIANVLWNDALLYEATWDPRYRQGADRWAKVLVSGQRSDGAWSDVCNHPNGQWSGEIKPAVIGGHVLPALIAYHRLTGNRLVAEAIVKGTEAMIGREPFLECFDALAYSYLLTGNAVYVDRGVDRIKDLIAKQQHTTDPTTNGMVYQAATYERVTPILSTVPMLLGVKETPAFPTMENAAATPSQPEAPGHALYDVLVVPSMQKVLPGAPLLGAHPNPAHVSLARNEYEAVQLVLKSERVALQQVTVIPHELKRTQGAGAIPREAIAWSAVGFVETKKPDYKVSHVGLWPDPLPEPAPFDVKPGFPQPIWLTIYASPDTLPGEYRGTVTIQPANAPAREVQLIVRVWNFALPATPTFQTAFDVYVNRIHSAYRDFFPEWWSRWDAQPGGLEQLEERFYEDLIRLRLAPILNLDVSSPEALRYLRRLRDRGLSAFAIGQHGGSFDNNWPDGGSAIETLLPMYRLYANELRQAGLLDRHYIYTYDEPAPGLPKVADVASMIHRADPELKNLVTLGEPIQVEKYKGWLQDIDIVCLRNVTFDAAQAAALKRMGKELWLYVSGPTPPFPTLVIDYPAIAYRVLPWMCWKYGITGLLYWSVNYWTTNPYENPMNTKWQQNGNGALYYPGPNGPVSSIRLEVLRDGVEDYGYLALLDRAVARVQSGASGQTPQAKELIAQAKQMLAIDPALVESMRVYTNDPQALLGARERIADLIEQLETYE